MVDVTARGDRFAAPQNALALDRLDNLLGLLTRIDAARRDAS